MNVVSDTGPINYLILISRVDLLSKLFQLVIVPMEVLEELTHEGASLMARQ